MRSFWPWWWWWGGCAGSHPFQIPLKYLGTLCSLWLCNLPLGVHDRCAGSKCHLKPPQSCSPGGGTPPEKSGVRPPGNKKSGFSATSPSCSSPMLWHMQRVVPGGSLHLPASHWGWEPHLVVIDDASWCWRWCLVAVMVTGWLVDGGHWSVNNSRRICFSAKNWTLKSKSMVSLRPDGTRIVQDIARCISSQRPLVDRSACQGNNTWREQSSRFVCYKLFVCLFVCLFVTSCRHIPLESPGSCCYSPKISPCTLLLEFAHYDMSKKGWHVEEILSPFLQ